MGTEEGNVMGEKQFEEGLVRAGAKTVSERDIVEVVAKSDEIKKKFRPGGPLQRFIVDGQLLIGMVKDYWSRKYRQAPVGVIGAAVFTLLYVFNPLDLIPDVLPIIGQIDDAALVAACLMLVEHDLRTYQAWKLGREQPPALPSGSTESQK
jgi:uncharacterized membrane protein YkvA (DUF1232 family)